MAIIDAEDRLLVAPYSWCAHVRREGDYYAASYIGGVYVLMHNLIMAPPPGMMVDHINGDGLLNVRENLRIATNQQNCFNRRKTSRPCSSVFKGVRWHKRDRRWIAEIKRDGISKYLGAFHSEAEAAMAYDSAARSMFGDYANLNFSHN